jgi:uncharacterized protein
MKDQSAERPLRVVLDTNVLIAAAYNPGSASARIVNLCRSGRLSMVVSPDVEREYELMLDRALHGKADREAIDAAIDRAEVHFPDETPRVVTADPADDMLLAAAVEGEADALVTNDAEVLKVHPYRGVQVLRPADFVRQFRDAL